MPCEIERLEIPVADGIHRLLFASRTGPHETHASTDPAQLRFTFAVPPP